MTKKYYIFLSTIMMLLITSNVAMANVQSPIYKDDIGRAHFLGRGGYTTMRQTQIDETQANIVNKTVNELSKPENIEPNNNSTEKRITNIINDSNEVPAASKNKIIYTPQNRQMDASAPYGYGMTNVYPSGVNESKTIYTDDLGRLHFFGKANKIKD